MIFFELPFALGSGLWVCNSCCLELPCAAAAMTLKLAFVMPLPYGKASTVRFEIGKCASFGAGSRAGVHQIKIRREEVAGALYACTA